MTFDRLDAWEADRSPCEWSTAAIAAIRVAAAGPVRCVVLKEQLGCEHGIKEERDASFAFNHES